MKSLNNHIVHKGSKGPLYVFLFLSVIIALIAPEQYASAQSKTTLDISKGSITLDNGTVSGKTPTGAAAAYNPSGYIITSSTGSTTANTITVNGGVHDIVLHNVKISTGYNGASPFSIAKEDAKVTLELSGSSTLTSGNPNKAALGVLPGAELVVGTVDGTNDHTLSAIGYGGYAAAIGGNAAEAAGTIVIENGTVNAKFTRSGNYGAAIGGGQGGAGGTIVIQDGNVTAESYGGNAAAIGGGQSSAGYAGKATSVTINGGTVSTKIPNAATYDSIGYGKVAASQATAVQAATTVVVNGGTITPRNDSNNITSLLYKRQPIDGKGQPVYAVGAKLDDAPANGTSVTVVQDGESFQTKTINSGYVYLFLPQGAHEVSVTRADTDAVYYGLLSVGEAASLQTATLSRAIKTVPVLSIVNDDDDDLELNDGKTSVLFVSNADAVQNGSGYPLSVGADFTVQWYKGTALIDSDEDDEFKLTVTPDENDVYRAKFIAVDGGKAAGESSYSASKKALGPKEQPLPGVATKLEVTSEAEFTRLPDPTAGAITYSLKLLSDDGANTPIEGATVRFYQDGSPYPYTRVSGKSDKAGEIQFTFSALLPGEHSIRIVYEGGKTNGVRYEGTSYYKTFTVIKPERPGLFATIAAKSGTTNGKILGTDESLEYIKWIPTIGNNQQIIQVTGNVIENLEPSLYSIRYKASYDDDVYRLASDYRYLVWVQTAQWTVTPVETDSVEWATAPTDVVAGGSAQFKVLPKEGYVINPEDIKIKYAQYSYDSVTNILSLHTITSNIQIEIHASPVNQENQAE